MTPQEISKAIRDGSMAFLHKEYKILIIFVLAVAILLLFFIGKPIAICFAAGAFLSVLAGNIGMRTATKYNLKTAEACQKNLITGLKKAFTAGTITSLTIVSLGLAGIIGLYLIFKNPQVIYGFGFGASAVALFARVGGGIYTKAADVGADLVGKVERGIPEDDPRNPAVIADNVGDNVGDVAGMGADLFESYVDSIIAAMVLAGLLIWQPLVLAAAGLAASLIGIFIIFLRKSGKLHNILNIGIWTSAILFAGASYFILRDLKIFIAVLAGLIAGVIIGQITEYYTSAKNKPAQALAKSAETGAGTNIIAGLALGMKSTIMPILAVCGAMFAAYYFAGFYGIALASVGMLSTLGITLATDTYGPVADNAAGIAEMGFMGKETRERAEELDALGNTTAAIGKGFAIGSAALTALVLSFSYAQIAGLMSIDLINPKVMIGLFIGGLLPFVFSAITMKAVGKTAQSVIEEARKQFKQNITDYSKCVEIVTSSALKQMILPGLLAIASPVVVGVVLGKAALGGLLAGAIVTGFLMAVMMANSGGAWDNAKKFIEAGNFGGKGSQTHKAAVVGDTVGDPFKDTSGPALNILIKLMSIVALIIAPLL
ncbi:MAG: sodium-translocating pyrophosphatase [bacterium]